tara:strand:- start:404 stop:532 length:129 start_codon:yes stop_codon:yes gene_type:complete
MFVDRSDGLMLKASGSFTDSLSDRKKMDWELSDLPIKFAQFV